MSDPFTVSGSLDADEQFEPVEAGVHQGVLAAVIFDPDMPGFQGGQSQNRMTFVWVTPDTLDEAGVAKHVRKMVAMPKNPMHPKANFRLTVESWLGRDLTQGEATNFDMRRLLGAKATLTTSIKTSGQGRKYARSSASRDRSRAPRACRQTWWCARRWCRIK